MEALNLASNPSFDCPVCGAELNGRLVATEVTYGGEVGIRSCPSCSLHYTWPRLSEPQGVYLGMTELQWRAKYQDISDGARLHDRHQNYLEEVKTVSRYVQSGNVLDVGCNAGWLLGYFKQTGRFRLEGVEPSPWLSRIASQRLNLPIHNCYVQQIAHRNGFYDAIIATDVFEHILPEDVGTFLDATLGLLKPGGYLFLKTPNRKFTAIKSQIAVHLPHAFKAIMLKGFQTWDAKEHVVHWDAANMRRVSLKHGFDVVRAFVPKPVETYNSPIGAVWSRKIIYVVSRVLGGAWRVPSIAQDIFQIARKPK